MAKHKATNLNTSVALQASGLPAGSDGAPEWIHILPAGEMTTTDGRGPYTITNAEAVIEASLQEAGGKIVVDENHSTDIAGKAGNPAPAAGWIAEMQSRADGVWAKVDWTKSGRKLVEGQSYRSISPVIIHNAANAIKRILRVSLTNKPNLRGMVALHHQMENMMELSVLIALLGLEEGATEEDVTAAIKKLADAKPDDNEGADDAAMQSALTAIADKFTGNVEAETVAICSAIDAAQDSTNSVPVSEFKALQSQMTAMQSNLGKDKAETVVDAAIKEGRVGVKPLRDHYIARHMANSDGAASVEKELAGLPRLDGTYAQGQIALQSSDTDKAGLSATERDVIAQLGIDPKEYAKTLKADDAAQEVL